MVFLNPERVERQGGQKQLCERSPEKGPFREKLEEKTKRKTPARIFGNLGHVRRSQRASQNPAQDAPVHPYLRTLGPNTPEPRRGARKNNALRKKWSEWYIAKENRPKGALVRKLIFLQPLRPKGYVAKSRKRSKTRLKLKSSSFLS